MGGLPGYTITVAPTAFDPRCMDAPEAHSVDIEFADPPNVDAVALNAESGIVECTRAGELGKRVGEVAIRDGTGLIRSCTQSSPPSESRGDWVESVQANQLLIRWTDEAGPAYVPITFARNAGHYEFASGDWCNSCSAGRFQILVDFSVPIDASTVWIGLDGRTPAPVATPTVEPQSTVFDCSPVPGASRHATLADLTGLVQSCAGTEPAGLLHPQPPVANPGGDLLRLVVEWAGTPCDASVAFTLQQTADGYTLDGQRPGGSCITPGVQHALEIRLSQPIDASTVVVQIPYQ